MIRVLCIAVMVLMIFALGFANSETGTAPPLELPDVVTPVESFTWFEAPGGIHFIYQRPEGGIGEVLLFRGQFSERVILTDGPTELIWTGHGTTWDRTTFRSARINRAELRAISGLPPR